MINKISTYIAEIIEGYSHILQGEITYRNEGLYLIADELFPHAIGCVTLHDIEEASQHIQKKLQYIDALIIEIKYASTLDITYKQLFSNKLEGYKNLFSMLMSTIWIEGEKGGYVLDPDIRDNLVARIDQMQQAYWGPIFSSEEISAIWTDFFQAYKQRGTVLEDGENEIFGAFLRKLQSSYSITESDISIAVSSMENNSPHNEVLDTIVSSQQQKMIFDVLLEVYGTLHPKSIIDSEKWEVVIDKQKYNFSINQFLQKIYIPWTSSRTLKNTLLVFAHEYEKHVISAMNTNYYLGRGFKGRRHLATEEGLAKIFEQITLGKIQSLEDIHDMKVRSDEKTRAILVCMHYGYNEAVHVLEIAQKLGMYDTMSPDKRVVRTKRFYPLDAPGAGLKDTAYQRGFNHLIDIFSSQKNLNEVYALIHKLNTLKVSRKDIGIVEAIVQGGEVCRSYFLARMVLCELSGGEKKGFTELDDIIYERAIDIDELVKKIMSIVA